ncbi:DNA repair and recombination protein RAD54-like protein [Klebsormidium nitens]|uniref:DNA repair and recombination protein RAD54-like protein n=1 Tax=Klebsormidium nitens TaxID=105231 RepID=A0A1Y1IIH2_KLENI|nr:DNA repair and recombination protein RAD54-like protein [Klebsormidium nitens]|eukprot:GAQ90503.1 DNA repair and recombination protein RAD54-like protein [Klebsormidium nitens]
MKELELALAKIEDRLIVFEQKLLDSRVARQERRATGGPCWRCGAVACCRWYSSPEHGPRSLCCPCHEVTVGGPCCRCGREKCISWYTGEKGSRTLCYNCYNQTRRPERKRRQRGRTVTEPDTAGSSGTKRKRPVRVGSEEMEEGGGEQRSQGDPVAGERRRASHAGRNKGGVSGSGTSRAPCNKESANGQEYVYEGEDPLLELDVMDVIGLFEAEENSARHRRAERQKAAAERKTQAETDSAEDSRSDDHGRSYRTSGPNVRGRGRENRHEEIGAMGEGNLAARAGVPRVHHAFPSAGDSEPGAVSVGEQGVEFGDCLLFEEFLAERRQEEGSGTGMETETEPETAQPEGGTEILYGRFYRVTGDFLGQAAVEHFSAGPGRAPQDDRSDWQDRCMGRMLERLWAQKEPAFAGWEDEARKGNKKRITLEDIPESPRSHSAAVRAAERRTPEELVAEHGSASAAAFWAVLEERKKAMKSQIEGFEFTIMNLTGSADGLSGQADTLGGASESGPAEIGGGSSCRAAFEGAGKGCILAHAPGCGKTLLGWALFWWLRRLYPGLRCLTLAPASVLEVWEHQRPVLMNTYHVGPAQGLRTGDVTEQEAGTNFARCLRDLREWAEKGDGMLLLSNERMRVLLTAAAATAPEVTRLLLEAPDVVFFDEAHNLRNDKTRLHQYIQYLRTPRRVLLTGTPFNNSFEELWTLLYFAQPDTMLRWGAHELRSAGGALTEVQARRAFLEVAKRERRALNAILAQVVHSSAKRAAAPSGGALTHTDMVVTLNMTSEQAGYYKAVGAGQAKRSSGGAEVGRMDDGSGAEAATGGNLFSMEHLLSVACVHPAALPPFKYEDLCSEEPSLPAYSDDVSISRSCKTLVLSWLVARVRATGRVVVFGVNVEPLRVIARGLLAHFPDWEMGQEIVHIDGAVSQSVRRERREWFNDPRSRAVVLLATVETCGEGVDLSGGTHAVLLQPVWNPTVNEQLIGRLVRPGQKGHVYILRLICCRSQENHIHERAVQKEQTRRDLFSPSGGMGDQVGPGVPSRHITNEGPLSTAAAHAPFVDSLRQLVDGKGRPIVADVIDYESLFKGKGMELQ